MSKKNRKVRPLVIFNMPPKKDSSSNSTNFLGQNEEDKILQAVVIADSFNERFMPITIDKPRVKGTALQTSQILILFY